MNVWDLLEDTDAAPQPAFDDAFSTYLRGAAQPAEEAAECVGFRVVSFNCGMPQSMLQNESRWKRDHAQAFQDMLQRLGPAGNNDLVFCSGVGEVRQGFFVSNVNQREVVSEAFREAQYSTASAYLNVWNIRNNAVSLKESKVWVATSAHGVDMFCQAYDLTYRGASQSAEKDASRRARQRVGLLVGNMQFPAKVVRPPTQATRRRIVELALNHLAGMEIPAWNVRQNFPVVRLLVGDCSLEKQDAEAVTQNVRLPPMTSLQRAFDVQQWQVRKVCFPLRALASARRQQINK